MRTVLFAALLAFSLPAFAGDAVDQALLDLGADESEKRDAAEKLLWNADGTAWERAKAVLEKSTDAEVKARLGPIVQWLAVQLKCAPLEAAWKDRWFVVRENGAIIGTEHQQATLENDAGLRTWRFTHESDCILKGSKPEHLRLVLRVRQDPHLTPIDGDLLMSGDEGAARMKFTWREGTLRTDVLEDSGKVSGLQRRSRGSEPLEREGNSPFTVDALMAERVERASLARLDRIEFLVNTFMVDQGTKCVLYVAQFGGTQSVEVGGKKVVARRYFHDAGEGGPAAEFWVSDTEGLVRAIIDRLELVRVDEATARAAGLDPESIRRREGKQCVDVLLAAEGEGARMKAELALLALPEALEAAREALNGTLDDDLKERFERCVNWLDPEFARAALSRLWGERYFQVEIDKRRIGAERYGAIAVDRGGKPALAWNGECASEGTRGVIRAGWSAHTRFDAILTPLDGEFRHISEDDARARWTIEVVEGRPVVHWVEGSMPRDDGDMAREDSEADEFAREDKNRMPTIFDPCLSALLERASLCRLPALSLQTWRLGIEDARTVRVANIRFKGEATETLHGTDCVVRHYVVSGTSREHYWLTDSAGLVRMTYDDCTVTPISREDWLASGWDEKSLVARAFKARLADLRGADLGASNEALLAFQASPESLPSLREAVASEKDAFCKSRLESLCRWLDPAFGGKELAAFGGARWFTNRERRVRRGWERIGVKVNADGRWVFSAGSDDGAGAAGGVSLETTFAGPDFGLTNSFDLDVDMHTRGTRVEIGATIRGASVSLKKVLMDGEELPVQGDTKVLSGAGRGAIIPSVLLPLFLERASLARLECVQVSTWNLTGGSRLSVRMFVYEGETRVSVNGKDVVTRKYEIAGNGEAGRFWISDDAGVVKFEQDGLESVLSTEADARKETDDAKDAPK